MITSEQTYIIKTIDFDVFSISLRSDRIYFIEIKPEKDFCIAHMEEVIQAEIELGAEILPILIFCNEFSSTNAELMNHLAKEGANPYASAEAYVLTSLNQRILGNFYSKIIRPARPTKLFNSAEEAEKWLCQFKKMEEAKSV